MKITYKDVGQGDSIILEWNEDSIRKIGVIDCNKKGKTNPVLNHIRDGKYDSIEFVILTHPHRDHFSGLMELMLYVESKGLSINLFAHTILHAGERFWKYFEIDSKDTRQLSQTIAKLRELREAGVVKRISGLMEGVPVPLTSNIKLTCLSPAHDDIQEYQRLVKFNADKNPKAASEAANFLSTVFLLEIDDTCGIFTSDAEISALEGVIKRNSPLFKGRALQLCQLPHHGSENNHCNLFWDALGKSDDRHAIASAGKHRTYNHPSYSVLRNFHDRGYAVHCTNILNGMKEFTEFLSAVTKRSSVLEGGSVIAEEYRKSMDRTFAYEKGKFQLLSQP